jgi:hypothetical protein
MHSIGRLLILSLGAAWLCPGRVLAEPRLLVAFIDGQHTSAPAAEMPWTAAGAKLPEAGPVLVGGKPVRWIRDPQQPQSSPAGPVVEFFGGDALPAKVVAYEKVSDGARSYLLVEPVAGRGDSEKQQPIRVSTAWIKRVVWERRRGSRYEPGSLFYRDGRQTSFRAARWTEGGVRLLEEQGTALVPFDQIAELHFPLVDAWSSYVGQLAQLSPGATAWLVKIETAGGLAATSSTTRSRFLSLAAPAADGPAASATDGPSLWLQPAWSLDPLSVSCAGVRGWAFFAPDEVPLSSLQPRKAVQRAMLGAGWPQYTVDCNVQGGPLRSGGDAFGWGLGVHAYSELEFDLPAFARSFSASVGLDEAAGVGGCVKATVSVTGPHAATLYASPTMIGSSQTIATGRLDLDGKLASGARLRLVVDPLSGARPPRADPLDIRDTFDWLEPLVRLDLVSLRRALADRYSEAVWQLAGWALQGESGRDWRVVNRPRSPTHIERGFRPMLELVASPLVLSRRVRLEAGRDQLEWLCRPLLGEAAACTVEVTVDGKRVDELRIAHDEQMSGPRRTSLAAFAGRQVELALTLTTSHGPLVIDWERLELVATNPPQAAKP